MKSQHIPPTFWTDSRIVSLPAEARLLMIGLICSANDGSVRRDADQLRRQIFPDDEVPVGVFLQMLSNVGLVEMADRIRLLDYLPTEPKPKPKTKPAPTPEFEEFYKTYPRRTGKPNALQTYCRSVPSVISHADLMAACKRFAQAMRGKEKQYIPHPATWLNRGNYADDPSDWGVQLEPKRAQPLSLEEAAEYNRTFTEEFCDV